MTADPIPLAQALIRRPSITPTDAGALDVLQRALEALGFRVQRLKFGEVDNLYARLGTEAPHFCFAGHTDVVPVGDAAAWSVDPFAAEIRDGLLYGRGAADMKAAIACMVTSVQNHIAAHGAPKGSISFLITGDEEGPAVDGTKKVLEAITAAGEKIDHCLVGEPTSVSDVGDVIKNGRRGSLNCVIEIIGHQGHAAYPALAANPVTPLLEALHKLKSRKLDDGAPGFDPSNLEVTTFDVGNLAHNVIPAKASAKLNIRFNTAHKAEDLSAWIETIARESAARAGCEANVRIAVTGHPFYTAPGAFTDLVQAAVRETLGAAGKLSTSGGTSDARFIKDYAQVAELGLQNDTAHKIDERVRIDDVRALSRVYGDILKRYFA